ncbi:cation-transporting P-type ATPase [bacterium]|nr:cation-transporting P-type ATPase [bacterium]
MADAEQLKTKQPWAESADSVMEKMDVDPAQGLPEEDVDARRAEFGRNQLRGEKEKTVLNIIIAQFKSLIVLLLAIAAALSFSFGDIIEGFSIIAVILINAAIGFFTEYKAVRSMAALKEMTQVTAKVRRGGTVHEIDAREIVPGDILVLNGGDVITADARLLEASKLQVKEAPLTGESLPVDKQVDALSEETPLAERANMVYKGTSVAMGSGEGIVVHTGMETELGNISSLVEEAEEEVTPLEQRLDNLGKKLIWATLSLAVVVALAGWGTGRELYLMIETAIALAVASIPEGLPIVATVALARGMQRMAKKNALINKLSSVETLGATSVIITDKTGTLTENQMTVTQVLLEEGRVAIGGEGLGLDGEFEWQNGHDGEEEISPAFEELLTVGVLCNNASLTREDGAVSEAVGEPMEIALKIAGLKADLDYQDLVDEKPEIREIAFEQATKMMATVHETDAGYLFAVKGSPEAVLEASSRVRTADGTREFSEQDHMEWMDKNENIADQGLRVIALARKEADSDEAEPYQDLTFLGLVGLMDPPRKEVRSAIDRCKAAGIRVIMATGDHGATAREVAHAVNLVDSQNDRYLLGTDLKKIEDASDEENAELYDTNIFARVNPEQKLDLISLHQDRGDIVAMTGDGVNDAPALKKADIGIAMGKRGTQVAKETADMVLEDDFFGTIVAAVEQGRAIFNNIRKFVLYLLSCNISEIMVVTTASVLTMPLPVKPLQILFLNLVTDIFPALALGLGEGDEQLMQEPPRDSAESIMKKRHWISIGVYGLLIMGAVLLGMTVALNSFGFSDAKATTVSFLILAFAQLWHVFDMRENGTGIFKNGVTANIFVWLAIVLCIGLLLAAVYVPFLADLLSLTDPGLSGWALILGASLAPMIISQVLKEFRLVK